MLTMEMTPVLDLSIEEIESLDAPDAAYWAGFVVGVIVVGVAVAAGIALT